jgi:hypothetical protein
MIAQNGQKGASTAKISLRMANKVNQRKETLIFMLAFLIYQEYRRQVFESVRAIFPILVRRVTLGSSCRGQR